MSTLNSALASSEHTVTLRYTVLEAAARLSADLTSIRNASSKEELEMLLLRLQAEKAAREVYALIS